MRKQYFLSISILASLLVHSTLVNAQNEFITTWYLDPSQTQITFGVETSGTVSYTWNSIYTTVTGAGTFTGNSFLLTGLSSSDIIKLKISPTNFKRIMIHSTLNANNLLSLDHWGTTAWTSMQSAFSSPITWQVSATDTPNLSGVTDMSYMFSGGGVNISNIANWNTSHITNMSYMFSCGFNGDVSNWDIRNVTDMSGMFAGSFNFDQDLSKWGPKLNPNVNLTDMFLPIGSGMSVNNYDALLKGFNASTVTGRNFGGGNFKYCRASAARDSLINIKGWTIADGGSNSPVPTFDFGSGITTCAGSSMPILPTISGNNVTGIWTPSVINNNASGVYTFSGSCGTRTTFTVTVNKITNVVTQPVSVYSNGNNVSTFSISAVGTNLSYLWSNGTTAAGINTSVAGSYLVTVSGICGTVISNVAGLKYNLTVQGFNLSRVYGTDNPPILGTISGVVPGYDVSVSFSSPATSLSGVGTYPIYASVTGSALANYELTTIAGNLTITKANQNIYPCPGAIGSELPAVFSLSGVEDTLYYNGGFCFAPTSGLPVSIKVFGNAVINASHIISFTGIGIVTVTAFQAGNENYEPIEFTIGHIQVVSASLPSITGVNCPQPCLPGKTITVLGSNLQSVTEVCFKTASGKACVAPTTATSGFVVVSIPINAIAGAVTLTGTSGNANFELEILTLRNTEFGNSSAIHIYPNPTQGSFIIETRSDAFSVRPLSQAAQIYNSQGSIVTEINLKEGINEVNLSLPKGIYLVKVASQTSKIVID